MFSATKFKNYFLEFATCSGNCRKVKAVLLFGNQHVDDSLFSSCDSVFNGVCI